MPRNAQIYQVFIASPGDIKEEIVVIHDIVEEWNIQHGEARSAFINVATWRTHSHPTAGGHPQYLINKQVVDKSDIIVGVFWTRFGTPTENAKSGTEEEIKRSISNGKKVMVYFSNRPINPDLFHKEKEEYEKIQKFREEYQRNGIYWLYNDIEEFKQYFRQHLSAVMNEFLSTVANVVLIAPSVFQQYLKTDLNYTIQSRGLKDGER